MNKNITSEQITTAFYLCNKYGIETFAYFIIGYINETKETINETINMAIKLNPDFAMFTTATPLPNTKLFYEAVDKGLIDKNYWRDYTLQKRKDRIPLLVKDADKWTKIAYKRFYFRFGFILKKILKLRNIDTLNKYIRAFFALNKL
jgi:radical SAM superfamily enzyme YgiQ (UPF0313 family)